MKNFIRGIFVILVGFCLLIWPHDSATILIKVLGGIFIASGAAILIYLLVSNHITDHSNLTVLNIASAALFIIAGFLLILKTQFFERFISYFFGAILLIYGIIQLFKTYRFNKGDGAKASLYIIPVLMILIGLFFFFNIINVISLFTLIFGVSLVLLGLSELIIAYRLRNVSKQLKEEAERSAAKIENKVEDVEAEVLDDDYKTDL